MYISLTFLIKKNSWESSCIVKQAIWEEDESEQSCFQFQRVLITFMFDGFLM